MCDNDDDGNDSDNDDRDDDGDDMWWWRRRSVWKEHLETYKGIVHFKQTAFFLDEA